ncbi:MAG: carboxy terminal-processing peptidase [Planctomycetes bacterium]|nr:carboxy terminal-processing peptidase [Planctomycetota bacterium]
MTKHPVAFLLAWLLALPAVLPAQLKEDPVSSRRDRRIMDRVATLLTRAHLTGQELDDKISQRAFAAFLETLDPLKLYLTQADIDEFQPLRNRLDDLMTKGDAKPAHDMWRRYIQRLEERTAWAEAQVDAEHDFTKDEQFVTDYDAAVWAKDEAAAKERWRRRVKYDLLRLKVDDVKTDEARKRLHRRYKSVLRRMKQLDNEDVLAFFITAVTQSFDPHTTYMSRRTLEDFQIHMRLNYQGIGARLNDEDGYAVIQSVMPGGAAKRQGILKKGDRIVSVGQGKEGELEDVVGLRLSDVVDRIRGKEGTVVRLGISPAGGGKTTIIEIVRAKTELLDEKAIAKVLPVQTQTGTLRVGVIDLPSFYGAMGRGADEARSATRDVRAFLEDFSKQHLDVVVLDLRLNGGGLLSEAIDIAGLFIDEGPVVQVKGFDRRVQVRNDENRGVAWNGPLVVLTSKFSASASEIVAGAIKDYRRGLVVGDDSTHGKGTVQHVLNLGRPRSRREVPEALGALKLTIEQFYRPSGLSTQLRGVPSDLVLPSFSNEISRGEAELDYAIPFDSIAPRSYPNLGLVDPALVSALRAKSDARLAKSKHFLELKRKIELYRQRKNRKSVTLNEAEYRRQRKEFASSEKDANDSVAAESTDRQIKRDEYLDEVLQLAADYAKLIEGRPLAMRR